MSTDRYGYLNRVLTSPPPPASVYSENEARLKDVVRAQTAQVADLQRENEALRDVASTLLAHLDRINPPAGPFWSGAQDQERARTALARSGGGS